MKKKFRISIRVVGVKKVLGEGLEPGELASQEIEYDLDPEVYSSARFQAELISQESDFINRTIVSVIKEVDSDPSTE